VTLAKIHVAESRYDQGRISRVSGAVQVALINTLLVPADDFYEMIFELPKNRFRHMTSFVGTHYTAVSGAKEKRLLSARAIPASTGAARTKKAYCAVAASILTAAYHMLRDGTFYQDLGADNFRNQSPAAQARKLAQRISKLSFACTITHEVAGVSVYLECPSGQASAQVAASSRPSATVLGCRTAW